MQEDFHYYATYCAAYLAGFSPEEAVEIGFAAAYVDFCTATMLKRLKAPISAATTQMNMEIADARTDIIGLMDITRIWASFHFLPYDLYAEKAHCSKRYLHRYRLICDSNGDLVVDTVMLAKGRSLPAMGLAMHVLADTWAHKYFAGTTSTVINSPTHFIDLNRNTKIEFHHSSSKADNLKDGVYNNAFYTMSETSIFSLGHGRAGHIPDYGYMRYSFMPSWADYKIFVKDNPSDYYSAFCQMLYALIIYHDGGTFEKNRYAEDVAEPYRNDIMNIINTQALMVNDEWREFATRLSGTDPGFFDVLRYNDEYINASEDKKDDTFLGKFILAALAQKSMVTAKIYQSGNPLAGYSIDYNSKGLKGIKDFWKLIDLQKET